MDRLRTDPDQRGNAGRSQTSLPQAQNAADGAGADAPGAMGTTRMRFQSGQAVTSEPLPPTRQDLARNVEFITQFTQRPTMGVKAHDERTCLWTMGDASRHEPPPGGSSYELSLLS